MLPKPQMMTCVPLLPVAVGLIVGIVLDRSAHVPPAATAASFVALVVLATFRALRMRLGAVLVLLASVCAGATLHLGVARVVPATRIDRYAVPEGAVARITGRVTSEPQQIAEPPNPFQRWTFASAQTAFLLDVEALEAVPHTVQASGRVRVNIHEPVLDLHQNERVEVFGRLHALTLPRNPGSFDWAAYNRQQGIVARVVCDRRANVRRLEPSQAAPHPTPIVWARQRARGLLTDDLAAGAPEQVSLLEAMVLGHRSRFDRRLNDIFTRAGVIHFIAVSGTNVAVLMSFVWLVGRAFCRTRRQCTSMMLVAVVAYACVADPRPPILRATVMGVLFCTSLWIQRPRAHLNWICAAAVVLVLVNPVTVFDAGFQLSFAAVLAVTYLAPALLAAVGAVGQKLRRPYAAQDAQLARAASPSPSDTVRLLRQFWRGARRTVVMVLAASLAAWLVSLPIVTVYFQQVQPWAPISSAVVFPMMSAVMLLGLAKVLCGGISQTAAGAVTAILDPLDRWLVWIVEEFSKLPGAGLRVSTPPVWLIAIYGLLLIAFVLRFAGYRTGQQGDGVSNMTSYRRPIRVPRFLLPMLAILFALGALAWVLPPKQADRLVITVLSVGRGSATVIEMPDGQVILYDAGSSYPSDVGKNTIVPFLTHRGIRRIDQVYISHPNLDHFSGLPTVLTELDASPVVLNACFGPKSLPRSPSAHLLDLLREAAARIDVLDPATRRWELGGATFELLSPLSECDAAKSANDASTVLRISHAGRAVLLTGDIEDRTQRALLAGGDLRADVLLLPHHGGVRSSTREFIQAVQPSIAIRSSHERAAETFNGIDRLLGDVPLYNTADLGAIQVVLDRDGVTVTTPCESKP